MQVEALQSEIATLQSRLAEVEEQAKQSRQHPEQQFSPPDPLASQEASPGRALTEESSHATADLQAAERRVQELSDQLQVAREEIAASSSAGDPSEGGLTTARAVCFVSLFTCCISC